MHPKFIYKIGEKMEDQILVQVNKKVSDQIWDKFRDIYDSQVSLNIKNKLNEKGTKIFKRG